MCTYCSVVLIWRNFLSVIWETIILVLASLWYRRKCRMLVEATPSSWVVHFVEVSLPLLCFGIRVNPVIWWFGGLEFIWVHSVSNMKINSHILARCMYKQCMSLVFWIHWFYRKIHRLD